MKGMENVWMQNNVKCWYLKSMSLEDPFLPCVIIQRSGDKLNLRALSGDLLTNVQYPAIFQRGENGDLIDDMVDIEFLNEAELLNNLKRRFLEKNIIFTYVGPTLLIVNPYKYIPELFDIDTMALYQKQIHNSSFTLKDLPPHIYGIAADLFKNLFINQRNQALVISGESGAGKTENTKFAMKFLISLGKLIFFFLIYIIFMKGNIMESKDAAAIDMFKSNNLKKRLSIKKVAIEEKVKNIPLFKITQQIFKFSIDFKLQPHFRSLRQRQDRPQR
jgi:Myosin head (motor domain)